MEGKEGAHTMVPVMDLAMSEAGGRRARRLTGTLLIVWGLSQQGEGLGSWEWTSDFWSDSFLLFSSLSQTLKLFNLCL